jgi:hypothetical protein
MGGIKTRIDSNFNENCYRCKSDDEQHNGDQNDLSDDYIDQYESSEELDGKYNVEVSQSHTDYAGKVNLIERKFRIESRISRMLSKIHV